MHAVLRLIFILVSFPVSAIAGGLDTAAFRLQNTARIHTDMMGMKVLGGWGLLNVASGVAGALSADRAEVRHFHQMNAAWGAVNIAIAGLGYLGARRESGKQYTAARALHRYEATKRLYLVNAGLDVLYISTGAFLAEHAKHSGGNAPLYRGFGRSLILQGAGLLLFDAAMFSVHHHQDKGWYRALEGFAVTGNGISWHYVLR